MKRNLVITAAVIFCAGNVMADTGSSNKHLNRSVPGGSAGINNISAKKSQDELATEKAMPKKEVIEDASINQENDTKKEHKKIVYRSRSGGSAMMNYRKAE